MKSILILIFGVVGLAACTPDENTSSIAERPRQELEKAKAVESQLQQAADAQRRKIEEQSE